MFVLNLVEAIFDLFKHSYVGNSLILGEVTKVRTRAVAVTSINHSGKLNSFIFPFINVL